MHRNTFNDYVVGERGAKRVIAAPRGYAKSTITALFRPIWDICYHEEKYIIIVSNTEDQAVQKIKDIRSELLENDFLISVYGRFFGYFNPSARSFETLNRGHKTLVQASGSKKELRGKRFGAFRPTKIILDDYEHSTEVESEVIREKAKNLYEDVFMRLGNKETNIEVVGTVLHRDSLLQKLLENPGYKRKKYKSIEKFSKRNDLWEEWKKIYTDLDNPQNIGDAQKYYEENEKEMLEGTEVLWPEFESYLDLQREIIEIGMRSFMKEKQNSPVSSEEKIFYPERIRYYVDYGKYIELEENKTRIDKRDLVPYAAVDPATGQTKAKKGRAGDFTCILNGYLDQRGRLFVHHDYTKRRPPSEYIRKLLQYNDEFGHKRIGVETNLYRNLLVQNIRDEHKRKKYDKKLQIYDIEQVENKNKRIYTIEPKVEHGWIYFNRSLSSEFFRQLFEFPSPDAHDDAPDALEMLWSLTHKYFPVGAFKR